MNEGERQKFEAWAAVIANDSNTFVRDRHGCYVDPEIEWAWQGYKLGRAEQPSQTPEVGPSCTFCGVPMIFRCPACGSTPELTGLSQTRAAAVPVEDRPALTPKEAK